MPIFRKLRKSLLNSTRTLNTIADRFFRLIPNQLVIATHQAPNPQFWGDMNPTLALAPPELGAVRQDLLHSFLDLVLHPEPEPLQLQSESKVRYKFLKNFTRVWWIVHSR